MTQEVWSVDTVSMRGKKEFHFDLVFRKEIRKLCKEILAMEVAVKAIYANPKNLAISFKGGTQPLT